MKWIWPHVKLDEGSSYLKNFEYHELIAKMVLKRELGTSDRKIWIEDDGI